MTNSFISPKSRLIAIVTAWVLAAIIAAFMWDFEEGPQELSERFVTILAAPILLTNWITDSITSIGHRTLFFLVCLFISITSVFSKKIYIFCPQLILLEILMTYSLLLETSILNARSHGPA